MDHIGLPEGALSPIDIPLLATLQFDSQDFETFPSRVGLPRPEEQEEWLDQSSDEIASFVKARLYLGLIAAFLERPIDIAEFKKPEPQVLFVVFFSSQACSLVSSLIHVPLLTDRSNAAAKSEVLQRRRVKRLLKRSSAALRRLELLPQANLSPLPEILLSVNTLMATLAVTAIGTHFKPFRSAPEKHRNKIYRLLQQLSPRVERLGVRPDPVGDIVSRELLSRGWCPFRVNHQLSDHTYLTLYYISRLPNVLAPHITHQACSKERCIGNNVDMANYTTRHAEPSCACAHSSVPVDKMRLIIANGGIPVVRVKSSKGGRLSLEVKMATPQVRYIAISHVWSDGLGNPHANSLPKCQLERLARSVKALMPPVFDVTRAIMSIPQLNVSLDARNLTVRWGSTEWFWLDTLCIPVGDQFLDLKIKAINQMAAIYAGAHQVLVLDSVLQAFSVSGNDACHTIARMSAIAWLGRCWTYQESALAFQIQVQCADCSFDPALFQQDPLDSNDDLYALLPGTTTNTRHRLAMGIFWSIKKLGRIMSGWANDILSRPEASPGPRVFVFSYIYRELQYILEREMSLETKRDTMAPDNSIVMEFIQCWNALARRTTTMPADIHVILANLLRFNAFSILSMTDNEERMQSILWSLPRLPLSILFNDSKDRVRPTEQHNNRWMPLWPNQYALEAKPTLEFTTGALLLDNRNQASRLRSRVLLLDQLYLTRTTSPDIVVCDKSNMEWYRVVLHRQPGDIFNSESFLTTAFILPPQTRSDAHSTESAAACLHVSERTGTLRADEVDATGDSTSETSPDSDILNLTAIFDCPSTVQSLGLAVPSQYSSLPRFQAQSTFYYTLSIKHGRLPVFVTAPFSIRLQSYILGQVGTNTLSLVDVPATQQPLPQRPRLVFFRAITLILILLCAPFGYILLAMTGLQMYQLVQQAPQFPVSVRILCYLNVILHSYTLCQLIPLILFFIPWVVTGLSLNIIPFAVGLAYLGTKGTHQGFLTPMDKAVAGLLVGGHVPQIAMVFFTKWYLNSRLYESWLDTYAPDWSPEATDQWLIRAHFIMEYLYESFLA